MTTIPTIRPAAPLSRVGHPTQQAGGAPLAPTIDPIKIVKKYKWMLLAAAGAGLLLGMATHFVMLMVYPIYSANILYECYPMQDSSGRGQPLIGLDEEFKRFMATQVQVLESDRVVNKALSEPRLLREAPKWTSQYMIGNVLDISPAAKDLKKNLSASVIGESNFIRLSFWWTDKTEAAAIVKVVGRAFEQDRKTSSSLDVNERKLQMAKSVDDTIESIKQKSLERLQILQEKKVESLDARLGETNRTISNLQQKLVELRGDREAVRVHRDKLKIELESNAGRTYPEDMRKRVEENPTVYKLKNDINDMQSSLSGLKAKGYSDDHRTVVELRNQIQGKQQQYESERERLLKQAFDADLDQLGVSLTSLEAQEADVTKKLEDSKVRAAELTELMAKVGDIDRDIDRLTETKGRLQEDQKRLDLDTRPSRVYLYQDADIPKVPAFPKLAILIPLGIFVGLGLMAGLIAIVEIVDQRVKSPADIAMIPRTRVLGLVPHAEEDPGSPQRVETVFRDLPAGVLAESYRQLRAAIVKRMQQAGHKSLLVMSGMPGSGATTVVSNLACALAAAEQRVLVIDANFRRPAQHRVFDIREGPGLSDVLAGSAKLSETVQTTQAERLHVLTAGSADKRLFEHLSTSPMSELLREAGERYDLILIDVAPAMVAGDAMAMANRCDATMLVVRALGEKRGMVARLRNELAETRTDFLGVLVNAVRSAAGGYLKGNILASHKYQNGKE